MFNKLFKKSVPWSEDYKAALQKVDDLEEVLRSVASYVGVGGYNSDTVDPVKFEEKIKEGIDEFVRVESARIKWREPTDAEVGSACLSYYHAYGLMDQADRSRLEFEAKEWLHAWRKEYGH